MNIYRFYSLVLIFCLTLLAPSAHAEKITIAAAADLKFTMDEIVVTFKKINPDDELDVIYGSSGKFHAQIQQGAPYDLFFSADIGFPRELVRRGFAASGVKPYAIGRTNNAPAAPHECYSTVVQFPAKIHRRSTHQLISLSIGNDLCRIEGSLEFINEGFPVAGKMDFWALQHV